jgi:23S rRNA (cytosine1962-C5)-methyltransferase
MSEIRIVLKRGKERPLQRGHPWVFSGAIASAEGEGAPGESACVYSHGGDFLGRGWWNPHSQIRVRIVTHRDRPLDAGLLRRRLETALSWRKILVDGTDAFRLLHAEGDGLPGTIVDRYGDWLVGQFLSAGSDRWKSVIAEMLLELTGARGFYDRSDTASRREEGLSPATGLLVGEEPPVTLTVAEDDIRLLSDPRKGHKTGLYLDQRDNRRLARRLAPGRRVLDCFCYTGAFGLASAAGGARSLTAVDESHHNLSMMERQMQENGLEGVPLDAVEGNAFEVLRSFGDRSFDLIVMDPPAFAPRARAVEAAARGYKDVNMQALRLLAPGGFLLTFSCSHHVDAGLFRKILFGAAVDARRRAQVVGRLGPPADHPVCLFHPQGEYLKGLLLHAPD